MSNEDIEFIRNSLLEWSKTNYRNYPWRETSDPYQILIAEIMLQRTKADQVDRMYTSFLTHYPNFQAINEAHMDELFEKLKSIGLYWRINNIKLISKIICEKYNGIIPSKKDELLKLPGVGDYIAGAFLISTYNQKCALLDSNIVRIINRLYGFPVSDNSRKSKLYKKTIESLIPENNPRIFFYSLLDFTYFICKPRNPKCTICQLQTVCMYGMKVRT